jgi:hypothetical protein
VTRHHQLLSSLVGLIFAGRLCADPAADAAFPQAPAQTSKLWGAHGERWNPASRLPDFSFAGYRSGEVPLPAPAVVANVKDFGAVGDGLADDTDAFVKAIAKVEAGAILIPAGRYKITRVIQIKKSNIVLRGAGPGLTTLVFPKSLSEIYGAPGYGVASDWTYSGGLIWVGTWTSTYKKAAVVADADRGSRVLTVSTTAGLKAGQTIRLSMSDDSTRSLNRHIYAEERIGTLPSIRFHSKITSISGNRITLERPLRLNVRKKWSPVIMSVAGQISEVGLEGFTMEFPEVPYKGHFKEDGHNGVFLFGSWNCWVRNLALHNCESGIFLEKSAFCTVDQVKFTATPSHRHFPWKKGKPQWFYTGHHGIQSRNSDDNLVNRFRFDASTHFYHYLSIENATGCVFMNGSAGNSMDFDHHGGGSYENLFTRIHLGDASRMWNSSGSATTGARSTFWNISAKPGSHAKAPPSYWPQVNVIAWPTRSPSSPDPLKHWLEAIPPASLSPANLHEAQLARRLPAKAAAGRKDPLNGGDPNPR